MQVPKCARPAAVRGAWSTRGTGGRGTSTRKATKGLPVPLSQVWQLRAPTARTAWPGGCATVGDSLGSLCPR